jgi:xylose dehydrogenase (NAD/NADP)
MAKQKLKWGILGASRMAATMLPSLLQAGNAELVAIASRRKGAAKELLAKAAPHLKVKTYDQPNLLLEDPEVEAVYLPMANEEHAAWALACVEHQKHVLVEKPLALSSADIQAIKHKADANQVKVMEGFMYRFHPQHQRVFELINSGTIGQIRSVRTAFSFLMRPERLYRISRPLEQGGGALWDIGCYAVHSARWFFDCPPNGVFALAKFNEHGADVTACGVLDFGDGRYALFDFSYERARRAEYELIGTLGGIKCHNVWAKPGEIPVISWWTEQGQLHEEKLQPQDHFRLEIEHFSAGVLNDSPLALSLEDSEINCRVLEGALQAFRAQRLISIGRDGGI